MGRIFMCLGWLLFIGIIANFVYEHSKRWECGRYYMPHTVLAADGTHYRDGSEVEAIQLMIARSGNEEEIWLGVIGLLLCMLALIVRYVSKAHRAVRDFERQQMMNVNDDSREPACVPEPEQKRGHLSIYRGESPTAAREGS